MFLTSRLFLYQQVYFHRTVRAIDLDLAEVFGPSIRAIFGDDSPADALAAYADLDEYALLHQAARWARGEDVSADAPRRPATVGHAGRRRRLAGDPPAPAALALRGGDPGRVRGRRPSRTSEIAALGEPEPGRVAIDLAVVDARPADATATDSLLAVEAPRRLVAVARPVARRGCRRTR